MTRCRALPPATAGTSTVTPSRATGFKPNTCVSVSRGCRPATTSTGSLEDLWLDYTPPEVLLGECSAPGADAERGACAAAAATGAVRSPAKARALDMWGLGCWLAELLVGEPLVRRMPCSLALQLHRPTLNSSVHSLGARPSSRHCGGRGRQRARRLPSLRTAWQPHLIVSPAVW